MIDMTLEPPDSSLTLNQHNEIKNLDKSFKILNFSMSMIGALAALIGLLLLIATGFGVFEASKWRKIRKEAESALEEVRKTEKTITRMTTQAEASLKRLREGVPRLKVGEKPSEELLKEADQYAFRYEMYEILGVPLTEKDYNSLAFLYGLKFVFDKELKYSEKSIEIDQDYAPAWLNKSQCYRRRENV
jgi:tetratricopeptide (TPR) repeat protein